MSSWMSASSSPNRNSARVLDSSVLPTPEGPAKMNEPPGRFGSLRPARVRRIAWDSALIACSWPMTRLCSSSSMRSRRERLLLGQLEDRDAGGGGEDLGDRAPRRPRRRRPCRRPSTRFSRSAFSASSFFSLSRSDAAFSKSCASIARLLLAADVGDPLVELAQVRRRRHPTDAQARAGLVDEVDRLVRQEPVGDVAVGQRRGGDERGVGDRDAVVRLVPVAQTLEDLDGVRERRLAAPGSAGSGARARRPSRRACGTRRAWWRRWSAARRGPASA